MAVRSAARPTRSPSETGVTATFCLSGADKALGQGHSTWAIVLSHRMAFKCKFPLGPKGELASALVFYSSEPICDPRLICIMGRMEMSAQLCQAKTKKKKGKRETGRLMPFCSAASGPHKGVTS